MMIIYDHYLNKVTLFNGKQVIGNKITKFLKNNTTMNVVNIIIHKIVY
jgi:hypothetical protein